MGVSAMNRQGINLKFYSKRICLFKVKNQQKRLEVIIFNQTFEPMSSLETIYTSGFSGLGISWEAVFSLKGISVMAFMTMCGLLVMSNVVCKEFL